MEEREQSRQQGAQQPGAGSDKPQVVPPEVVRDAVKV